MYTRTLLRKCIDAMINNVNIEREKKEKIKLADDHFISHKGREMLREWRKYTIDHINKTRMRRIADERYAFLAKRKYLHLWEFHAQHVQYVDTTTNLADQFRKKALSTRVLLTWYIKCIEKQQEDRHWIRACEFDRVRLLKMCMNALVQYLHQRRQDAQDNTLAFDTSRMIRLMRAFNIWREQTHWSMHENESLARAQIFHKRRNLSRYFRHWKLMLQQEQAKHDLEQKAIETNELLVKMKFMHIWKQEYDHLVQEKQHEDEFIREIRGRLNLNILKRVFTSWRTYHDGKAMDKAKTALAYTTYTQSLMRQSLRVWVSYVMYRRQKYELNSRARLHLVCTIGKDSLKRWKEAYNMALLDHANMRRARDVHNKNIKKHALQDWKKFMRYRRSKVTRRVEAAKLRADLLLRRGVSQWLEAGIQKRQTRIDYTSNESFQKRNINFTVERCARHWHYLTMMNRKQRSFPLSNKLYPKVLPNTPQLPIVAPSENILPQPFTSNTRRPQPRPLPVEYLQSIIQPQQPVTVMVPPLPQFMQSTHSAPVTSRTLKPSQEDIERINTLGKDLRWFIDFTPVYEKEKRDRLRIKEVLNARDGQALLPSEKEALERVLSILETRAKKYLDFKREKLVVIQDALRTYKDRFREV